jgi:hypothetical protein
MEQLMNDRDLRVPGIIARGALEVTAAQVDDAAVPAGEGEYSGLTALRAPSPVEENDQPEIVLWARGQFRQSLGQRQPAAVAELGQHRLTLGFRQPLGCAPESASRSISSERIGNEHSSPGKFTGCLSTGACAGTGQKRKADDAERRDGASSNRCMGHAVDRGPPCSAKLEIGPEFRLKNREFSPGAQLGAFVTMFQIPWDADAG